IGAAARMDATIIWDLEDDADGNVQHLLEHDVTIEEAEEVLLDPESSRGTSRTSGLPTAFGWTTTGRHMAVGYELVDDDPLTLRPVTAYDVPPPGPMKRRKTMKARRVFRPNQKSAEERFRERALRDKLQKERPSLEDLVRTGDCDPDAVMTMGM